MSAGSLRPLRLHRHRRRPQRPGLRGHAGARRALRAGAGGAAAGRRRGAHARVRARLQGLRPARTSCISCRPICSRSCDLGAHGLDWAAQGMATTALSADGAPLPVAAGPARRRTTLPTRPTAAQMRRFARALAPLLSKVPPRLGTGDWKDLSALAGLAWRVRRLGRARHARAAAHRRHERARPAGGAFRRRSALKGALAFDAVLGTNFGPRSPGTVLTLLYRLAAEAASGTRRARPAARRRRRRGDALARAAVAAGATIRTGARRCKRILVESDRAAGVELESGERIAARTSWSRTPIPRPPSSACSARRTSTPASCAGCGICAPRGSPRSCTWRSTARRVSRRRRAALRGRLLIAPSLAISGARLQPFQVRRILLGARHGDHAAVDATIPALAPAGKHVLSAVVQYAPYALKDGWAQGAASASSSCASGSWTGTRPASSRASWRPSC